MLATTIQTTPRTGEKRQFLAWAADVPYMVTYEPGGFGLFDMFSFIRADDDFTGTMADEKRTLPADPQDVDAAGPEDFISSILDSAAQVQKRELEQAA
ncbi:hypothetical protein [Magnetospira sp. QH-2]|uniref:hypothetical protein n=1 Tax=Magnetospira sp. (strain QH-2) TaxID=1288970 RepID=UPI0003E81755|nr:hypothetical protein [Magnetospira sp. QH-2]CCQ75768.1 Protein of unknown function [Magnetospira sp. QH-2]